MKIRKDMIFAVLTTFCLSALMFAVIPIRSGLPYDPWADINDDGKINMYDIGYTARLFGTTGTAINKTELLLGLQAQIDSLKASLIDLINQTRNIYEVEIKAYCPIESKDLSVDITKNEIPSGYNTTSKLILIGDNTFTVPLIGPNNHTFTHWNTGSTNTTITVSSAGVYTAYYEPSAPDWFNGLIGYWKLDEGIGSIAGDSSGNNNNGTLQNSPVWVDGKYGKALSFDGTDDYVEVPQSSSLDIVDSVSVTAWVYPTASPNLATILSRWYDGTESDRGIVLQLHNGSCFFAVIDDSNHLSATFSFEINKWYYIAATWNGLVSRIYVNGIEIGNRYTAGSFTNQNINLGIGSDLDPFQAQFNGTIDNVMIYNRALSEEEVRAHYLLPPP